MELISNLTTSKYQDSSRNHELIDRSYLIDSVRRTFNKHTKIVVLDGEVGCGKSEFVKQFHYRQSSNSVLIAVNRINPVSLNENGIIWELIVQICEICGRRIPDDEGRAESILAKYITYLRHYLKSRNIRDFYVIVDGFDQIPFENAKRISYTINFFVDLSVDSLNYLITGNNELLKKIFDQLHWIQATRTVLSKFSMDETKQLLEAEMDNNEELFSHIHRISSGNPTTIQTLLRLMRRTEDANFPRSLTTEIDVEKLFKVEYDLYKERFDDIDSLLSVIIYGEVRFTREQLIGIIGMTKQRLLEITNFAAIFEINGDTLHLNSDSIARFLRKNLRHLEMSALKKIVAYINNHPSDSSLNGSLIKYNHRIGNSSEVVRLLSPVYCEQMLADNHSYNSLIENIDMGLQNVVKYDSTKDILRLSILKSILTDRSGLSLLTLEMLSRLALDDIEAAIEIALNVKTVEDRFKLLTLLASQIVNSKKPVPENVMIHIKELFPRINFKPDNNLLELIKLSMDFSIEIAISLINILRETFNDDELVDSIISEITVDKITNGSIETLSAESNLLENITNKNLRDFIAGLSDISTYTDDDFIRLFNTSENKFAKITIIRLWIRSVTDEANIPLIINKVLDYAIGTTELVINASLLNDITAPVHLLTDRTAFVQLHKRISELFESPNAIRPTIDHIKLRERFVRTAIKLNSDAGVDDYSQIYETVNEVNDLTTRLHGILVIINSIDASMHNLESSAKIMKFRQEIVDAFFTQLETGLRESSIHENIYNPIMGDLAKSDEKLIRQFYNVTIPHLTDSRKVSLYMDGLSAYLNHCETPWSMNLIQFLFNNLKKQAEKEIIALWILSRLIQIGEVPESTRNTCIELIEKVVEKSHSHAFLLNAYNMLSIFKGNYNSSENSPYEKEIFRIISEIPCTYSQIVVNYKVSNLLAESNIETSREILRNVESLKSSIEYSNFTTTPLNHKLLSLLIRCLPGLDRNHDIFNETLDFLHTQIQRMPSEIVQLRIYVEMAERFYLSDRIVELNQIVQEHIFKILDRNSSQSGYKDLLLDAANVVYFTNPARFESSIAKVFDYDSKKQIVNKVISFLMNRCAGGDRCEVKKSDRQLTYDTTLQILSLLKYLHEDKIISGILSTLIETISLKKQDYSREQIIDISSKIEIIISNKLPDSRNIKHDGYVIWLKSSLARISQRKSKLILEDLRKLYEDASKIPNISDEAFVKSRILETVGFVEKDEYFIRDLVNDINSLIERIPVFEERMERLENFLQILSNIDRAKCKNYLKGIFDSFKNSEGAYLEIQKEFIDLAYKLDKNLAEKLVTIYDDDPARSKIGNSLKKYLSHIRVVSDFEHTKEQKLQYLPELATLLLKKLNSGLFTPKSFKDLKEYLLLASQLPFDDAYFVYQFVIQNCVVKYKNTNEASTYLIEITRSILSNIQLVNMIDRNYQADVWPKIIDTSENKSTTIILPGEREKALNLITEWLVSIEPQEIVLIDPYFEPNAVDFFKLIKVHCPGSMVRILTSIQKYEIKFEDLGNQYQAAWQSICAEEVPDNEITFVNKKDYLGTPLHDRSLISLDTKTGMSLGTSYGSLGIKKVSSITKLDSGDVVSIIENYVMPFMQQRIKRLSDNSKLTYQIYSIE